MQWQDYILGVCYYANLSCCDIFHIFFLYRIANSGLKNDSDNDEDDRDIDWSFTLDKKRKYCSLTYQLGGGGVRVPWTLVTGEVLLTRKLEGRKKEKCRKE